MNKEQLSEKTLLELQEIAKELGLSGFSKLKKSELTELLLEKLPEEEKKPPQKEAEEDGEKDSLLRVF